MSGSARLHRREFFQDGIHAFFDREQQTVSHMDRRGFGFDFDVNDMFAADDEFPSFIDPVQFNQRHTRDVCPAQLEFQARFHSRRPRSRRRRRRRNRSVPQLVSIATLAAGIGQP